VFSALPKELDGSVAFSRGARGAGPAILLGAYSERAPIERESTIREEAL